jgi:hypothetical protein
LCFNRDVITLFIIINQDLKTDLFLIANGHYYTRIEELEKYPPLLPDFGAQLKIVPLSEIAPGDSLPNSVREVIMKTYGTYPVKNELKSILIGKGGISITTSLRTESGDVFNLIKFGEDLYRLLLR